MLGYKLNLSFLVVLYFIKTPGIFASVDINDVLDEDRSSKPQAEMGGIFKEFTK